VFFDDCLNPLWSLWRPTKGKRDFVKFPSDTDQVARESKLSLLGCFEWIAEYLAAEQGVLWTDVTPKLILDHWRERAEDCSVAFLFLLWARFLMLILSIEVTEKSGDWRTYCLIMPCIHLLFAIANATNYVVLVSSERLWWKLASRAMHILQAKVGFVKRTRFGKFIFAGMGFDLISMHVCCLNDLHACVLPECVCMAVVAGAAAGISFH
jgi:hypothetical protein